MNRYTSERLILEPVTVLNAPALWRIMQSGHLRDYQDIPRFTRQEFERRVAGRPKVFDPRATGRFEWLIMLAASREPIGWISLRLGDHARGSAEIGYSILAPHRGLGYATEAARALISGTFETSDLAQIEACCVPENTASRKLLATLGFIEARVQRNGAIVRGKPVDVVIHEMPRTHWQSKAHVTVSGAPQGRAVEGPP
jgi:ribosomal-protein-alanine N-acetyltransferase